MADEFDPYYTWLGIPPAEQPADHYRLIGLRQFEGNADVISNALDQKMQFLRTLQVGKHSALSQKLLNEISAAGGCLLDPQKKQAYDQDLKKKEAAKQAAAQAKVPSAKPLSRAMPLPVARPAASHPAAATVTLSSASQPVELVPKVKFSGRGNGSRPSTSWKLPAMMVGGVVGLAALVLVVAFASGLFSPSERKNVPAKLPRHTPVVPEKTVTKPATKVPAVEVVKPAKTKPPDNNIAKPPPGPAVQEWWNDPSHNERLLALQIDRTAFAELPDSASQSTLATPLTAEFWLRLNQLGNQPVQILGTRWGGAGAVSKGWGLFAQRTLEGGQPKYQLYLEFWKPSGEWVRNPPVVLPATNQWHHVAFVFEPEVRSRLYIDGRPVDFPAEKNLTSSQRNLVLGSEMQAPGENFQAAFCGLRVSAGIRYGEAFSPPAPLGMEPDDATFAALDCRLLQPSHISSSKTAYPWLYGMGKFDGQTKRIIKFQPLRYGSDLQWQGGERQPTPNLGWIALNAIGGHAGNDADHAAVRRWVAPQDGKLTISGQLRHFTTQRAGDGVRARIVSSRIGPTGEWQAFFSASETQVPSLQVQAGDTVDFSVECVRDADCDSFEWIVDLKLVDAEQRLVGAWNSAKDFRVLPIPGGAGTTARLREPARSKAVWIPLYTAIESSQSKSELKPAQLVDQHIPAVASTNTKPLVLKPAPMNPKTPTPFGPPTAATKSAVPDAAALVKAQAEVQATLGDPDAAKTPALKQELANKFLELAKADDIQPPTRYALLQIVRRLAVEGRDATMATKAVEMLGAQFEVDLLAEKIKLFESLAAKANLTQAQRGEVLSSVCDLGYEALDADKLESLPAIAAVARPMIAKAPKEAQEEAKEFLDAYLHIQKRMEAIKKAEKTLATAPNEPGANLVLGLHYFFTRGDPQKGLPLLAKGGNKDLAAAAMAREQNIARGVPTTLEEADAWFGAIDEKVLVEYKINLQKQALECYTFLAASGTSLEKVKAKEICAKLSAALTTASGRATPKRIRPQDLPETTPGMIGRLLINGRDAGVLLTYKPSRDLEVTRLTAVMTQARATVGRLVLEGTISCPADMFVRIIQNSQGNDGARIVLIDGKPANDASGNTAPRSGSIPLAAGDHVIRWVYDFDASSTPRIDVYSDMGGRLRRLDLVCPRAQNYEARKPPTKEEINLSN